MASIIFRIIVIFSQNETMNKQDRDESIALKKPEVNIITKLYLTFSSDSEFTLKILY